MKELMASNPKELTLDPFDMAWGLVFAPNCHLIGFSPSLWDAGHTTITTATLLQWHTLSIKKFIPLLARAVSESVGARREWMCVQRAIYAGNMLPLAGSERAAAMTWSFLESEDIWGPGPFRKRLMDACGVYR